MSETACADLCVQWNEDYDEDWGLSDPVTLVGENLTGWTLKLQIRSAAGVSGNPLLALAIVTDSTVTGITMPIPSSGIFVVRIVQADLQALASSVGPQNMLRLAYDFIAIDASGVRRALVAGAFIIKPGVTL